MGNATLSGVLRKLVKRKVAEALADIEPELITEEAEEAGLNPRQIQNRIEDGTVEEIVTNLKTEIEELLQDE